MTNKIIAPGNQWQVFSHLLALCNQDGLFCIEQPKTETNFEKLVVGDTQGTRKADSEIKGNVIGLVRLLPYNNDTVIVFEEKDPWFHAQITEKQKQLFHLFRERVDSHFIGLTGANIPKKPKKDAPREDWFEYYHACKKAPIKYTLNDL